MTTKTSRSPMTTKPIFYAGQTVILRTPSRIRGTEPNSLTAAPGWVYECRTCALSTGHTSECWTNCTARYTPKEMP